MDRNTVIGFSLIFLLMLAWFYLTMPTEEEMAQQRRERALQDSLAQIEMVEEDSIRRQETVNRQTSPGSTTITENETESEPVQSGIFTMRQDSVTKEFTVETPLYTAVFSNKGAGPAKFILKEYNTWSGTPVQMISDTSGSAYNIGFLSTENYNIETQDLIFDQLNAGSSMFTDQDEIKELSYRLDVGDGREIVYTYSFNGYNYEIDLDVQFIGVREYIIGKSIDFGWTSPLNFTEKDIVQDALVTSAYFYSGGELEQLKVSDFEENDGYKEQNVNGTIEWVATKTKFFAQLIQPVSQSEGAYLTGEVDGPVDEPLTNHNYSASVTTDIPENGTVSFELYIGPMKYYDMKGFNEHAFDMVEVGYGWLRWFSDPFVRFIVIPFFTFFSGFISNYGVLIIIFATSVKLVLSPLTVKSYRSMAAMRELQPQMKEIQDKYKDNPQKQQKATMELYRKNKVNPLGGCLPMLLQFPILITLWRFFQNSILLRQESFIWVTDLSAPDYILDLPFTIPFLGDQIAGLVLLMSLSMVFQSRVSSTTNGSAGSNNPMAQQMKIMQYFLPVMLLFFFNNFASGLSLYYLIFNLLSIVQQLYINKTTHQAAEAKS